MTHSQLRSLPDLPAHDSAECFDKFMHLITQNVQGRSDDTNMLIVDLSHVGLNPSQLKRDLLCAIGEEKLARLQLNGLSERYRKMLAPHFAARPLRAFAISAIKF